MRLRLIAPVLLVIAATAAGAFVLARMDSTADAWLVLATGLALAAVTAALAVATQRRGRATREVERYFTLSPEMVILAGFDGYWKRVNPAVEAVLGYTEREALTRPFMEFVHPDDRERSEEEARRVVGGATALAFENRILCKDGSFKLIEWSVKPVPEEGVMYGVGRDITERRRSESEQAALERIATLVAQEAPQADVFGAIAEEIGGLLGTEEIRMLRFDGDGSAIVVAGSGRRDVFPLGSKQHLEGDSVLSRVLRTERPERIDDYWATAGPFAETARAIGVRAVVGAPVLVQGRLWGVIATASTKDEPLPPDTESRLARFTDLMATAIANAEARAETQRLADEQAALRRVATLVARDTPSTEVFEAVATEVARLLGTDITVLGRYDDDGAATAIGSWSASPVGVPVGTRSVIGGHNVLSIVAETGKPARVEGYDDATGEAADIARRFGWSSSIAAPVIVEGRLWGVMLVATQRAEPFPAGAEERLAAFTELVATAVANAQANDEVRRFGDEQAALLRVATLVAAGSPPETVFTAGVEEVSSLLGLDRIELVRYEGDAIGTVIAASGDHPFPAGSSWSLDDPSVMATVARTRRAARIDDYTNLDGEIARTARSAGFQSAIGAPITVEGRLWGVIIAISTDPEPIPERSEARLGQFTELFATAVANAQARAEVERLADEQSALRRVATLVAHGTEPVTVFRAVCNEAQALLGADLAAILTFHDDRAVTVVASSGGPGQHSVGTRVAFDPGFVVDWVYETHQAARFDTDDPSAADLPEIVRRIGVRSAVGSPIVVDGELWGVIVLASLDRSLPLGMERRLADFTALVATAIANADGKSALNASRRRIVAASDNARRRIERDLHDGVQQQLVSLRLRLDDMQADPPTRDALREQLAGVTEEVGSVLSGLVEISRGIHPAILSQGGLGPALQGLARRSAVPVELDAQIECPLPDEVEVAAYYVVSEALTNVAKYARASRVHIDATTDDGTLKLVVRDDGIGGAVAGAGSGLVGLQDRAEALGGTIKIDSSAGNGTCVVATLPIAAEAAEEIENVLDPPQELGSPTSSA